MTKSLRRLRSISERRKAFDYSADRRSRHLPADPLAMLRVILDRMHNASSLDELLAQTVSALDQNMRTSVSSVLQLVPQQQQMLVRAILSIKLRHKASTTLPLDAGLVGAAAHSQSTVVSQDTLNDPRFVPVDGWATRAELCVPIITRQGIWGILNLESEQVNAFPTNLVEVVEIVAKQLAIAVENTDLVNQSREQTLLLERRARELTQVLTLNNQMRISMDLDTLLEQQAQAIRQVLGFQVVIINLVDVARNHVRVASAVGCPPEQQARLRNATYDWDSFLGDEPERFRVSHSYFYPQEAHHRTSGLYLIAILDARAPHEWQADDMLLIPITSHHGEVLGVFSVDNPIDRQRPSLATIQGLEIFAAQAAAAIENARLFAQTQAALDALRQAHEQQAQLIDQIHQAQDELITTSKLAAVGTLAAGVAHEFNNLLAGMHGYAELGQIGTLAEKDEALAIVQRTCQRGAQITRRLLTFARQGNGTAELVQINEIAEGAIQLIGWELTKASITIVRDYRSKDFIMAEPGQMMQVVLNLLSNARDATPAGGSITVSTCATATTIELAVRDTGSGIPDEIRPRIFEPFVTTKGALGGSVVAGTGLGLSVSYGIIQAHGGRMLVESTLGAGSCLTIVLPQHNDLGQPDPPARPAQPVLRALKILVVDDEPQVLNVLAQLLARAGHAVAQAHDGLEVLERSANEHWDLIISDMTMPKLDGAGMAAQLHAMHDTTPIILMTGRVDAEAIATIQNSGVAAVLEKPFDQNSLLVAIATALPPL